MRKILEITIYQFVCILLYHKLGLQGPMFLCSKNLEIEYLLKQNNLHK